MKKHKLPKELTTVTPFSKFIALCLFAILPFGGFLIGMKYQAKVDTQNQQMINSNLQLQTTPAIDMNTSNWKTYTNSQYHFQFLYPSNYTVSQKTPCDLITKDASSCIASMTINPAPDSPFIPAASFFLLNSINSVYLQGSTMAIHFNAQKNVWEYEYGAGDKEVIDDLHPTDYTHSGAEIIKGSTGNSSNSSQYYIIPDYKNNVAAVFQIPTAYRLRCNFMAPSSKQTQCNNFYQSVVKQYGTPVPPDTWLPEKYLGSVYSDSLTIAKSFSFTSN